MSETESMSWDDNIPCSEVSVVCLHVGTDTRSFYSKCFCSEITDTVVIAKTNFV